MRVGRLRGRGLLAGWGAAALRCAVAAAALAVGTGLLASCAANRNALGTGASPCYEAIPVAARAVHGHGRFLGVRRVPFRMLRAHLGEEGVRRRRTYCVVAYRDAYGPGFVQGAPAWASGPYALVVVSSPGDRVVRVVLLHHLPLRFSHL